MSERIERAFGMRITAAILMHIGSVSRYGKGDLCTELSCSYCR